MPGDYITTFAPAFVASALVIATHVPLGREVLRAGIVFLDLAVAQAAGLGMILAGLWHFSEKDLIVQLSAGGAALAAAAFLTWTERWAGRLQEALIGSLFVLTACMGLIALAANPLGGEHLHDLLAGQVLWVTWDDIGPVALLYALVLFAWFGFSQRLGRIGFYGLFAVTVTASVQLVGIYLVFGTLILPALAAHRLPIWQGLLLAYITAAAGYGFGFWLTGALDLPAGPVIVCMLVLSVVVVGLARWRMLRKCSFAAEPT